VASNPHRAAAEADDTLMTANELASYLRCHLTSIYRLLKRNSLPAFKVGGTWRFSRREIDRWMARQPTVDAKG
jgi:excisionase family DNA binding protein